MQPHNPMLDMYRNLSGDVVELGRGLLSKSFLVSENEKDSPALSRAKSEWQQVPRLLEQIDRAIVDLGETIFAVSTDSRLNDDAKRDDIGSAASATQTLISANVEDIQGRVTRILDGLRAAAYPARPLPADATQEARLAGIKGDLRMVWDAVTDDGDFVPAMGASLRRSLGDGDELTTWLLASSRWPEDYLRSRGAELRIPMWEGEVAIILDSLSPADLSDARRIYRSLADGRDGLPLLNVLFARLAGIINDLARWRPSSYEPTPWSRAS